MNHGGVITLVEVQGQRVLADDGVNQDPAAPGNLTKQGHAASDASDPSNERFTITITEAEDGSTTFSKPNIAGRSAGSSGHREASDTLDTAELLPGTPSAGSDTATRALPSTLRDGSSVSRALCTSCASAPSESFAMTSTRERSGAIAARFEAETMTWSGSALSL